jgi:hypothetical protein
MDSYLNQSVTMSINRSTDASADDVAVAAGNSGKLSEGGYDVVNLPQVIVEENLWGGI